MLNPAPPPEELFVPGAFIAFAVLGIIMAIVMFFAQRSESIGRWRRIWSSRIMIPVFFVLCCGLVGGIFFQSSASNESDSARMSREIGRVYGVEVSQTEASKLMDGGIVVVDDTAYRLEDNRLVEAVEWEATDVAQ